MKRIKILVLVCVAFLVAGYSGCTDPQMKEAKAIVRMPPTERRQALAALSPERQLDVYVFAASNVEPPLLLAGDIAPHGQLVLPALKRRLASEQNEVRFTQLLLILVAMSAETCSLEQRNDVLDVVRQRIERMTTSNKQLADHLVGQITHPTNKLNPCE